MVSAPVPSEPTKQKWKNIEIVETIIDGVCICNNEDDTNILNNNDAKWLNDLTETESYL